MTSPIDVLHLIDTYRIGGPGKTILNSARYIDGARFRIHVASFTPGRAGDSEFAAAARTAGVPYLQLRETRRVNPGHVAELRRYCRSHDIRILHTHGYRTDLLGYLATRGLTTRIVTTHHGWIRNNRRQAIFATLALRLARRFDGVELVSEEMRQQLPWTFRHSDRVSVVRNGIVLADYVPRGQRDRVREALGVGHGDPLIGVIGRLSTEKGSIEMLDVFRRVHAVRQDARLVFVGEGPLRDELADRVAAAGMAERVRFVAHQTDIRPYFEAIDLLASPSKTEGLSNVILEALAFGKPVVATRVGGNAEILENGVSGVLVRHEDPDPMAEAILSVINTPALSARLVEAGRRRVQDFSFDARMRVEESFYEVALTRR